MTRIAWAIGKWIYLRHHGLNYTDFRASLSAWEQSLWEWANRVVSASEPEK